MVEEGRDLRGYTDRYDVSNIGRVRNKQTNKILKTYLHISGYEEVHTTYNGKTIHILIHRAVAESFIDNPENKKYINHIDCNKTNNNISNLEWCTPKENAQHAAKNGRYKRKLNKEDREFIVNNFRKYGVVKLSKMFDITSGYIYRLCSQK